MRVVIPSSLMTSRAQTILFELSFEVKFLKTNSRIASPCNKKPGSQILFFFLLVNNNCHPAMFLLLGALDFKRSHTKIN